MYAHTCLYQTQDCEETSRDRCHGHIELLDHIEHNGASIPRYACQYHRWLGKLGLVPIGDPLLRFEHEGKGGYITNHAAHELYMGMYGRFVATSA